MSSLTTRPNLNQRRIEAFAHRPEEDANESVGWLLHVLRKRRWWILGPVFAVPLITIAAVLQLPDQYTSTAMFALIQQQVPKQYVDQLTSTTSSAEMIRAVTREVLAVPRLSGIVDSFGLFASERGKLTSEQLGEKLREQIEVMPVDQTSPRADYTAFRLSFTADNAKLSQQVLSQLSSLFIEVNLKERGSQAQTTTQFLKSQLDIAKKRLDDQERVLLQARVNTSGQSPALNQAKMGMLSDLRMQLQNANTSLARLQQQRAQIESTLSAQAARLQNERNSLLAMYTAKHPEILKKDKEVEAVQNALTSVRKGQGIPAGLSTDPVLAQMINQMELNLSETERLERESTTLRQEVARYQSGLLSTSPVREHELETAQKDYEMLKQDYADLQTKYFRAQLTANLEEEQSGQNFRLVDPPTLPALPSGPKRLKISLGSIGAGFAIGLILAFIAEMRNRTFLREGDVRKAYQGALVIGIPVLTTPGEEHVRLRNTALEWAAACILLIVVGAAQYYIFLHG